MSDNYQPMWALVDGYRKLAESVLSSAEGTAFVNWWPAQQKAKDYTLLADTLETALREATGDLPIKDAEPPQVDIIDTPTDDLANAYADVIRALEDASTALHRIADRSGHTVRIVDANYSRVIGKRCDYALLSLRKIGRTAQGAK